MKRHTCNNHPRITDCGPNPSIVNIQCLTRANTNFRTALWTGESLQVTLMCIPAGEEIGLEMHSDVDQFICIEEGCAFVKMGECKDHMDCCKKVTCGCAILVPACTWHNIINDGCTPLKLYSVYAPPQHPFGTDQRCMEEAEECEKTCCHDR